MYIRTWVYMCMCVCVLDLSMYCILFLTINSHENLAPCTLFSLVLCSKQGLWHILG